MPQIAQSQIDLEEEIMRAIIQIDDCDGASLDNIKGYLSSALNQMPDLESIQSSLDNAVDKGLLLKLNNGTYRIKETARSVENDEAQDPISVRIEHLKTLINEANEIKEAAKSAEKTMEDANSVIEELVSKLAIGQAKIRKTSGCIEETTKVASSASKQLPSVSITEDAKSINQEFLLKAANEIKEAAKSAEETMEDANSVIKELLSKLTLGQAKIRKTSGCIEESTKVANNASKQLLSASTDAKNTTGETPTHAEEAALDANSISKEFLLKAADEKDKTKVTVKHEEIPQDANQNTDPNTNTNVIRAENVGAPAVKDDAISDILYDKNDVKKVLKENK